MNTRILIERYKCRTILRQNKRPPYVTVVPDGVPIWKKVKINSVKKIKRKICSKLIASFRNRSES